jgi:hypothetical protein
MRVGVRVRMAGRGVRGVVDADAGGGMVHNMLSRSRIRYDHYLLTYLCIYSVRLVG